MIFSLQPWERRLWEAVVNARARIPQEVKTQGRIGWRKNQWKHYRPQDRIPDGVKAQELISTGEMLQISI